MNCKECGLKITYKKKNERKFCNPKCKTKFYSRSVNKGPVRKKHTLVCNFCNKEFKAVRKTRKFCSSVCASNKSKIYLNIPQCLNSADRKLDRNIGYVRVYCPMHKESNGWGYVYEHRLVAEIMLGRELLKTEIVHHKNGVRWDNRPENLKVMDFKEHSKLPRNSYENTGTPDCTFDITKYLDSMHVESRKSKI